MGELSFLTIVVSLAVCSLLIYAVFQYMKVRLNVLEQSQKEQALILQQFIEESSTDINRLYKISANNGRQYEPQGSIILEYANEHNSDHEHPNQKQPAYNEPHMIHLDTAIFQNKKSNLIEISSDSENTTDSESDDSSSETESDTESSSSKNDRESERENDGDGDSDGDGDGDGDGDRDKIHPVLVVETSDEQVSSIITELDNNICHTVNPSSDIKLVTVDLGTIQESLHSKSSSPESASDVLNLLYKKSQEQPVTVESRPAPAPAPAPANVSYTSMSVIELRHLLKEKYKQHPEKYAEIQKLKKAELVYALQNANV